MANILGDILNVPLSLIGGITGAIGKMQYDNGIDSTYSRGYAKKKEQEDSLNVQNDLAAFRKEGRDLGGPGTAEQKATSEIANSDKYANAIDQQYGADAQGQARSNLSTKLTDLANLKKEYELSEGNTGYQAAIADKANALRNSISSDAQRYGINVGSDLSAADFQNTVNAFNAQNNRPATASASAQNTGNAASSDNLANISRDIGTRQAQIDQRTKALGLDSTDPEDRRLAIANQLKSKGYSPQAIAQGLQYYDSAAQRQKAVEEEGAKKQALASVINTLNTSKDPDTRNTALIAYDLLMGGKNAPEYYKAGQPDYSIHDTDYGGSIGSTLIDKKTGIKGSSLAPKSLDPKDILASDTTLTKTDKDNATRVLLEQMGNYTTLLGIDKKGMYDLKLEAEKSKGTGKLNDMQKSAINVVQTAIKDGTMTDLAKTADGQKMIETYKSAYNTLNNLITPDEYQSLITKREAAYVDDEPNPDRRRELAKRDIDSGLSAKGYKIGSY